MSCVLMLQRGHSGDGCVLASTLCKYDFRNGDLFVLSWARVRRVRRGSLSSELLMCGGGVRKYVQEFFSPMVIGTLPKSQCLGLMSHILTESFKYFLLFLIIRKQLFPQLLSLLSSSFIKFSHLCIIFIIISLILSFTHLITPDEVILCTVQQEGPPDHILRYVFPRLEDPVTDCW